MKTVVSNQCLFFYFTFMNKIPYLDIFKGLEGGVEGLGGVTGGKETTGET